MKTEFEKIDLRKLEADEQGVIREMRRELEQREPSPDRWRAHFVASGKQASGKVTG